MSGSSITANVPGDFFIAGKKKVSHWRAFEATLTPGQDPDLWQRAFKEYFHARLSHRYLKPIEALQKIGSKSGEGFSIVAIQCSLIEFLESTLKGISYRHHRKGDPPLRQYEYSESGRIFESFLVQRTPFDREFTPQLAHDFYVSVRCGVLHEARTKNGWTIQAKSKTGQVIDANLHTLYRDDFQASLLAFVEWYEKALPSDPALQEAFVRKFNDLCV
jgi:hypothetical protein